MHENENAAANLLTVFYGRQNQGKKNALRKERIFITD